MTRRRVVQHVSRPLARPATPVPSQGPRPAAASHADRRPAAVVVVLYGDGLAQVYADPDQVSVKIVTLPAIHPSRACVALADELIAASVPWPHRQVLYPRCRKEVHVRNCPTIADLQRILLDRAFHDELNRLIAQRRGVPKDGGHDGA